MKLARRHPDCIRIDKGLLPICGRAPGLAAGRAEPALPEGEDGDIGQHKKNEDSAHAHTVMTGRAGVNRLTRREGFQPARARPSSTGLGTNRMSIAPINSRTSASTSGQPPPLTQRIGVVP